MMFFSFAKPGPSVHARKLILEGGKYHHKKSYNWSLNKKGKI